MISGGPSAPLVATACSDWRAGIPHRPVRTGRGIPSTSHSRFQKFQSNVTAGASTQCLRLAMASRPAPRLVGRLALQLRHPGSGSGSWVTSKGLATLQILGIIADGARCNLTLAGRAVLSYAPWSGAACFCLRSAGFLLLASLQGSHSGPSKFALLCDNDQEQELLGLSRAVGGRVLWLTPRVVTGPAAPQAPMPALQEPTRGQVGTAEAVGAGASQRGAPDAGDAAVSAPAGAPTEGPGVLQGEAAAGVTAHEDVHRILQEYAGDPSFQQLVRRLSEEYKSALLRAAGIPEGAAWWD